MKTAVIRHRVADFLKQHAPFDALPEPDLLALAGSGRVKFHESEEYIFRKGDRAGPMLFVIQQGRVDLLDELPSGEHLRDVLCEGDILGLDRLLGDGKQRLSARTESDVLLYAMDGALFESLAAAHPAVRRFVDSHVSAAGAFVEGKSWLDADPPPPAFLRSCAADAPASSNASLLTTREAVRQMIACGATEIATGDGVLTAQDLALFCDHNPILLAQRIRDSRDTATLAPLLGCARRYVLDALGSPDDVPDAALLGTAFLNSALQAAAQIASHEITNAGMDAPACAFCWVAFGTAARGEMLRPALPNLAVIYDDSAGPLAPAWFAALAGQTIGCLHASGLDGPGLNWPEGAQPGMPLSEWKRFYFDAFSNPLGANLYGRREFLDLRLVAGDAGLFDALLSDMNRELASRPFAIPLLANDTLSHLPPLTLFRGLVVQMDGVQADRLDVRTSVLNPVSDAARVIALAQGAGASGTLERLAAEEHTALFAEAAAAFRSALYFEALAGESKIDPARLGRQHQRVLKTGFAAVQRLLEYTFETFAP